MNELISIANHVIGGRHVETVLARDLHALLEVGRDYSSWIAARINKGDFLSDKDYVCSLPQTGERRKGGQNRTEHHISVDMAKHLALMERNEMGRKFRDYMIERDDRLRQIESEHALPNPPAQQHVQPIPGDHYMIAHQQAVAVLRSCLEAAEILGAPLHIAQVEAVKEVDDATGVDLRPLLAHAPAQQGLTHDDEYLEPTELGKAFELSARKMNRVLEVLGMQVRGIDKTWQATIAGEAISTRHHWVKGNKSGYNLKWHVASVEQLMETFNSDSMSKEPRQ